MSTQYPFIPPNKSFLFVKIENEFMAAAKEFAKNFAIGKSMPTGSVVVKDEKIIGRGANGSTYHNDHPCKREILKIPTGKNYEMCEGCHPKNHSEARAIEDSNKSGQKTDGADIYLWGHWWCCEPCWKKIVSAKIKTVYLLEKSEELFNKEHPKNIVGRQFENGDK